MRSKSHITFYISHLNLVHLTDQLSNFRIIPDYLKVVYFIEDVEE